MGWSEVSRWATEDPGLQMGAGTRGSFNSSWKPGRSEVTSVSLSYTICKKDQEKLDIGLPWWSSG